MTPGTRLGAYEVVAAIGSGGMGEVYRARDTRLDRDVAIKVIPESLARDPDRVARFEREAKSVAALSHPNILTLFDTGTVDGTLFVVMELLSGETLRERLARGPLPARKAVEIATLVANGLAAAHDKGLVHRDLKPENVFLTSDGQVKILDFGLARSMAPVAAGSETRAAMTDAGTILGTVGYMSPEQVRSQVADGRADLFALGALVYEMLSGRRAFDRPTAAETMTAILNDDPADLLSIRPQVSPALARIVQHCLEKQPADRFQTARDVSFALSSLSGSGSEIPGPPVGARLPQFGRERLAWALATLLLAAVVSWLAVDRPATSPPAPPAVRAMLLLPDGVRLSTAAPSRRFDVSPDGRKVAFVGERGDERTLWIQTLSETSPNPVAGTDGASGPVWLSDNRTVAFVQNRELKLLDAEGGRPILARGPSGISAWSPSGERLVVDTSRGDVSIMAADGTEQRVLTFDSERGQRVGYASFLPDSTRILYALFDFANPEVSGFYAVDRSGASPAMLARAVPESDHVNAVFASGYLLSARDGMVVARRMTLDPLAVDGELHQVAGPLEADPAGSAAFSASETGVLVFQPRMTNEYSRLFWFDRSGTRLSKVGDDAGYTNLELSRDGTRLLAGIPDPATRLRDIWVIDLARGVRTRLTFDQADERSASWSPDDSSIVFRGRSGQLYSRPAGPGEETPFIVGGPGKDPRGWSPDGKYFVYRVSGPTGNDIWLKRVDSPDPPAPFLATAFSENYAEFSPDGRLLAYVSNESGADEVYVTRFPQGGMKERVSVNGGSFPRWRGDGGELFYLRPDGRMMAAGVRATETALKIDAAQSLFDTGVVHDPGMPYVVSRDGRQFLINTAVPSSAPPALHVIVNWPALVKRPQ